MRRPLANTTAIPNGRSRSVVSLPPITLTLTSLLPSVCVSLDCVRSRLSPRCNVFSVIPWIRQNSLRARPLVPNSLTSRWTSCRVRRRRRCLTSSGSVIRPLGKSMPEEGVPKCFAYVQSYDTKPKRRFFEVEKPQDPQPHQHGTLPSAPRDALSARPPDLRPRPERSIA